MVERKVLTLAVMDSSPIADHRCLSKMFACFNKKYTKRLDKYTKLVWSSWILSLFMREWEVLHQATKCGLASMEDWDDLKLKYSHNRRG